MRLFVSLAAYREPHLEFTLDQLFDKAAQPQHLRIGLVDQSTDAAAAWLDGKPWRAQVRRRHFAPGESQGVCWARDHAMRLYAGEAYFLQIDSHTFFFPGWDSTLIDLHRQLEARIDKPLISAYPPPFEFDAEGDPVIRQPATALVSRIVPETGERLRADCATLRFRGDWLADADFALGYHLAAGFLFARGDFVREVPYDPQLYFHGEEQNLALRAWTRGWNIAHPRQDWIPLLHLYKAAGPSQPSQHWHPSEDTAHAEAWQALAALSDARLLALVRGEIPGAHGLGDARTLAQFAQFSGLDYRGCRRPPR